MATAMLNVRLDKSLKAEVDRVLAKHGVSASEVVRGLYRFIGQNDEVPDFCLRESVGLSPEARRHKMRRLVGIAKLGPGEDLRALKDERLMKMGL